ncbi:MAG: low molecular weight protein arginine phosphatase [Defluviitaleaceae bacterium]|nr:low molecular weight protein arginine phosphatase [Defluviitaleaceae bacterium]
MSKILRKILFVCTGNTCRSPMARVLADSIFKEQGLALEADSVGAFARNGTAASVNAVAVAYEDYRLDLAAHGAKMVSLPLVEESVLIIAVTQRHKELLLREYSEHADKIHTFAEICEEADAGDVDDPFGGDLEVYRACAAQMKKYLDKIDWGKYL